MRGAGAPPPGYDAREVASRTMDRPAWLHFGAGNIFRGYIAALSHRLLSEGLTDVGIVPVESFDFDIIDKIYEPHDSLALLVTLRHDGSASREVIGGLSRGLTTRDCDAAELRACFAYPGLQMVSFTITEKGYVIPSPESDPGNPVCVMAALTALMLHRYKTCAAPVALVSMDNCSRNGERLSRAVLSVARGWRDGGFVDEGFIGYLSDGARVSFPWSMIDKITPRPSDAVREMLERDGIEGMSPIVTSRGTYIAPFVNAEEAQYLVVEDSFPNGRPPLERAGVYMTDRDAVNGAERMKVTACLNPLHTALAVFGCLLGFDSIAAEVRDPLLLGLIKRIGYGEGLPAVPGGGVLDPRAFLDEVVEKRLPNPFIPDTPQRIATDTSQKIPIRFGETIKAYAEKGRIGELTGIPLAIAGWLRYLLAVDDRLNPIQVSGDPLLDRLQTALEGVAPLGSGEPDGETVSKKLAPLLRDPELFGVDLEKAGIDAKITGYFARMLCGKGAVARVLREEIG